MLYQQPKPHIRLRICQMELHSVLQVLLQPKKNILLTSFVQDMSREDRRIITQKQPICNAQILVEKKGLFTLGRMW